MHRRAAAFMLACICALTSAAADPVPSIASTSLCGDGYVLALAPEQVAYLSWQSKDQLSAASAKAKQLPQIWDDPEVLAASKADVIIFGPGEGTRAESALKSRGVRMATLPWQEDFDGVYENLRTAADIIGAAERADAIIADIQKRRSALKSGAAQPAPKVLYISRSGGTAGSGTYVDAAISAAGGENLITSPGWQTLDVEAYIALQPDLIITSFFTDGYESAQALPVRHKAMREFVANHSSAEIPGKLWPCAGPQLIDAAEQIGAALDNIGAEKAAP